MRMFRRVLNRVLRLLNSSPRTEVQQRAWAVQAQEGEFEFHKSNEWRKTRDFELHSARLFEHFGLTRAAYAGKTVLDLGCGSRLRTKYFADSRLIALEPLADRFLAEIDWCDLKDAAEVYSVPAEELVQACVGRVDLLVSINVLDHCFNFAQIVGNIRDYLAPDGMAFLSFDKHGEADEMHPLELTEEICDAIFENQGLKVLRRSTGLGAVNGDGRQTYGHGPYCLNYWLTRAQAGA